MHIQCIWVFYSFIFSAIVLYLLFIVIIIFIHIQRISMKLPSLVSTVTFIVIVTL